MAILTYHTQNSTYEMNMANSVYRRTPREGGLVQVPSHRATYNEWLPLKSYSVTMFDGDEILHILAPDSVFGIITSPLVRTEAD